MSQDLDQTERATERTAQTREAYPSPERRQPIELNVPRVLAGALAAASAAFAASWLGVAGTVLGAVVVSLVASVSSTLYAHPIERSSKAIKETLPVLPARQQRANVASGATAVAPRTLPDRSPTRRIRWGAIAATTAMTLGLGFVILTGFETLVGTPASSLIGNARDGGTTVSRILHGNAGNTSGSGQQDQNSPSTGGAPTQGGTASSDAPVESTTGAPQDSTSPTEPAPTEAPSSDAAPTQAPQTQIPEKDPAAQTPAAPPAS